MSPTDTVVARQLATLQMQRDADQHVIAALAEKGVQDQSQIDHLTQALTTSRRIGAAVGIVMATHSVDEEQAFQLLSAVSHKMQRKVRDVAAQVVASRTLLD